MNVIAISGNISKDAEIRYTTTGDPVANFSVADNQGKDKEAVFWNAGLYGKRAESLSKFLTKGQAVTITGSISTNKYTDKNGIERIGYNVRVQDVALQGGKRDEPKQEKPKGSQGSGFDDMQDDVPF
jgi:single-strand DNA-binding protein